MRIKFTPEIPRITIVDVLQRAVLVHSYIYYHLDDNILSDSSYNELARQLVEETNKLSEDEQELTDLWYAFHDFTAATAFDVYSRLKIVDKIKIDRAANHVMRLVKRREQK